ncbi:hypothetical protein [Aeromonas molluscorum]|jgi:predicted DNA repair protein MutK|uniref:Uncharacterized protein n=1 Tax=Aeromonas molluscorum 848 TaxID=1268236 RepID=R1F5D9_9GAMM|nr:hypothetical protein [Aeromonas molluscorum]EOD54982.1 hypothetical protein G113_11374 [Aeromonas molluscorum 848]
MAGTSLLALLDDIATVLDDVAQMSKMMAKKCCREPKGHVATDMRSC